MLPRDYKDITGGGILILLGVGTALYASTNYSVGTMRQMGPGMFPMFMGILLAGLGVSTAVPAFFRAGAAFTFNTRPLFAIAGGLVSFPLVYPLLGLIPAILSTSILASFADSSSSLRSKVLLAIALSVICYIVFILGLRMPMAPFRSPF